MNPRTVTERLIWLKQHATSRRVEAPRIAQAYTDELHTYAALFATTSRTDPDFAARIINTLVEEIARTRAREGIVTDPDFDINPIDEVSA